MLRCTQSGTQILRVFQMAEDNGLDKTEKAFLGGKSEGGRGTGGTSGNLCAGKGLFEGEVLADDLKDFTGLWGSAHASRRDVLRTFSELAL